MNPWSSRQALSKNHFWQLRFGGATFPLLSNSKLLTATTWVHHILPWCLVCCCRSGPETEVKSQHKSPPVMAVGKVWSTLWNQENKMNLPRRLPVHLCLLHLTITEGGLPAPELQQARLATADFNDKTSTLCRVPWNPDTEDVVNVLHCHGDSVLSLSRTETGSSAVKWHGCALPHMVDFSFPFQAPRNWRSKALMWNCRQK